MSSLWLRFCWASRWGHPGGPPPYMDVWNKEPLPIPYHASSPASKIQTIYCICMHRSLMPGYLCTLHLDLSLRPFSSELWHSLIQCLVSIATGLQALDYFVCHAASSRLVLSLSTERGSCSDMSLSLRQGWKRQAGILQADHMGNVSLVLLGLQPSTLAVVLGSRHTHSLAASPDTADDMLLGPSTAEGR